MANILLRHKDRREIYIGSNYEIVTNAMKRRTCEIGLEAKIWSRIYNTAFGLTIYVNRRWYIIVQFPLFLVGVSFLKLNISGSVNCELILNNKV